MGHEIRCKSGAIRCNKLLAKTDGPYLFIMCPRCDKFHQITILELVEELKDYFTDLEIAALKAHQETIMQLAGGLKNYLGDVEAEAAAVSGRGFML